MVTTDFRDLLAELTARGSRAWGLSETVAPEALREAARLGDEATFLYVAGVRPDEDNASCLSQMVSNLDSEATREALVREGKRWKVRSIVTASVKALSCIKQSLDDDWSPARAGMVFRALPIMAGCRFTPLGERLTQVLGAEAKPEILIGAYTAAFCRNDRKVLAAVDAVIIDDQGLGTLALEMASRLLQQLGGRTIWLDQSATDRLVNCLALLIEGIIRKSTVKCDSN